MNNNMRKPDISVIIPVYNAEKHLQRCIDSLIDQSLESIELIFVDDGSDDGSASIISLAAEKDTRIRFFKQINKGPSAARNNGLTYAAGEYIMFCDSDDVVEKDWCERLLEAIREFPDAWISCGMTVRDEAGNKIASYNGNGRLLAKNDYWSVFADGLSGSPCNKIYRSDIIRQNALIFDESLMRGEDVLFNLAYLSAVDSIYTLKLSLYNYYQYSSLDTLTNRYHKDDFSLQVMLYAARKPYISEDDLNQFYRHYWIVLSKVLENNYKLNGEDNWIQRIRLNQKCIEYPEYQELLHLFGKNEMHPLAYSCLTSKWYLGYWMIQMASKFKHIREQKK